MYSIKDVRVVYGSQLILSIDELLFESGKKYGIIGENGSGKTTLLKVISQWLVPTHGNVTGFNKVDVGYMPQKPFIFSISVLNNVLIALEGGSDAEQRAFSALEKVGLNGLAKRRADRLSGGEMQRLSLARMIVKPRQVLLLDEPSSATDIRGTDQIEKILDAYCAETRCTLIMTTHSPAQALRMVDEVIYLEDGQMVEHGPADQVIRHTDNPKTLAFLQHWHI